jgi:hypothetical protein
VKQTPPSEAKQFPIAGSTFASYLSSAVRRVVSHPAILRAFTHSNQIATAFPAQTKTPGTLLFIVYPLHKHPHNSIRRTHNQTHLSKEPTGLESFPGSATRAQQQSKRKREEEKERKRRTRSFFGLSHSSPYFSFQKFSFSPVL